MRVVRQTGDLLITTDAGLYCPDGRFHIDPWGPVDHAVITHAHGDHASIGSRNYLCALDGQEVLQTRLGPESFVEGRDYGERIAINGVHVTFYPAGHILGSAQVLIERHGERCVVSGDYKTTPDDTTCRPFEPVPCDTFVTESTFGLPIYRWRAQHEIFDEINAWWSSNADAGQVSLIYAYSLGKAQRVLSGLDPAIGPIFCHGSVQRMNSVYRRAGIALPDTQYAGLFAGHVESKRAMVVAPPSSRATPWLRRFGDYASAFASGWMQIRGMRRRRTIERGFVLSDHADWDGLQSAIRATGASRVLVTHGSVGTMVRYLNEQGFQSAPLHTRYEGEQDEVADPLEQVEEAPTSP